MCDYRSKFKRKYKCPHPNYGPGKDNEGTFCIFHSDNKDKDVEKFYKKFEKLILEKAGLANLDVKIWES